MTLKRIIVAISGFLMSPWIAAQVVPNAGELLRQQQTLSEAPEIQRQPLYEVQTPALDQSETVFFVKTITISGNKSINEEDFKGLVAGYQGRDLRLRDLQQLCVEISQHYSDQGYLFSRALVPQQTIRDGVLTLQVIEARLGEVNVESPSSESSELFEEILAKVKSQKVIDRREFSRALLMIKDLPGIEVSASLRAGQEKGLSDLRVTVVEQAPKHQFGMSNHGSAQTRRERVFGNFNFANVFGHGDSLGLALQSSGSNMSQASVNYDIGLRANADHLGLSVSYLDYGLGGNLKDINAEGEAKNLGVSWRHNWLRQLEYNLSSQVGLQYVTLDDRLYDGAFENQRDISSLSVSLNGDVQNRWLYGGISSARIAFSYGDVSITNAAAKSRDGAGANTADQFHHFNIDTYHRQALSPQLEFLLHLGWQQAGNNLDSSHKQGLAGPQGVRAYDIGSLSGDSGLLARAELHYSLAGLKIPNLSLYGFVDGAKATINYELWPQVTGDNRVDIAGAGVGVRWKSQSWNVDVFASAAIGPQPVELESSESRRIWLRLSTQL